MDAGLRFLDNGNPSSIEALTGIDENLLSTHNAIVITHGHEDHIGSLAHFALSRRLPICATGFTAELIRRKFESAGIRDANIIEMVGNKPLNFGEAEIEYFQMSHSIPDAFAVIITMNGQRFFHTGDFKFDFGKGVHYFSNIIGLQNWGENGIDVLVSDSTNTNVDGFCGSEEIVTNTVGQLIGASKKRTFIATFSSHVHRIANLALMCRDLGKKPMLGSKTIANYFGIASRSGLIPDMILSDQLLNSYFLNPATDDDCVIFVTGTQGESGSSLERMAQGIHPRFQLGRNDRVIVSARTIPGNESQVRMMLDLLSKKGCDVITSRTEPGVHVSGHGFKADIQLLATLLKPKFYIPMHGDLKMQQAGLKALGNVVLPLESCALIAEGQGVAFDGGGFRAVPSFEPQIKLVDVQSKSTLSASDVSERSRAGVAGVVFGSATFDSLRRTWISPFWIAAIGHSWLGSDQSLFIEKLVHEKLHFEIFQNRVVDPDFLGKIAEDLLERYLSKHFRTRPVVRCRIFFQSDS